MALWPYDLLLRFGYELPEHDYIWDGKWFDDRFEAAALDLRTTAAKLFLALPQLDAAVAALEAALDGPLAGLRAASVWAPLTVDMAAAYLRRLCDGTAAVAPHCLGSVGRAVAGDRNSLAALVHSPALAELDPALAGLLRPPPPLRRVIGRAFATASADLYTVAGTAGDAPALPHSATKAMRQSAAVTRQAAGQVAEAVQSACRWLDDLLAHMQQQVADRAEDGADLLERWADDDWAVLPGVTGADVVRYVPAWPAAAAAAPGIAGAVTPTS
jgi:hypothetical protein